MKIKGNPVPPSVRKQLRKQFKVTKTSDEKAQTEPSRPRQTFAFREGDLVSVKREYLPAHLPTDGIITGIDLTKTMFDVLLGTEKLTIWGGQIKYSISR
jgi:hypothetical protein